MHDSVLPKDSRRETTVRDRGLELGGRVDELSAALGDLTGSVSTADEEERGLDIALASVLGRGGGGGDGACFLDSGD